MADIKKGTVYPKQQLELIEILKEKPYGQSGKSLLPIMAKNLSLPEGDPLYGKPCKFTIFSDSLRASITAMKVGDRFITDIEERERPDTQYGPDRTIVQIYVNGQPVSVKKGGGYGKSPEQLRQELENNLALEAVKRRSIEGQTSMAQVGEILSQGINPCGGDLDEKRWRLILGKYWQAVEKGLDNFLSPPIKTPPAPVKTTADEDFEKLGQDKSQKPSTATKPSVTPPAVENKETASTKQGKPHQDEAPPAQRKARNPESILTKNDLAIACHEDFNMQPKEILDYFHIKGWTELKKSFAEAYRDIQATRPD